MNGLCLVSDPFWYSLMDLFCLKRFFNEGSFKQEIIDNGFQDLLERTERHVHKIHAEAKWVRTFKMLKPSNVEVNICMHLRIQDFSKREAYMCKWTKFGNFRCGSFLVKMNNVFLSIKPLKSSKNPNWAISLFTTCTQYGVSISVSKREVSVHT